VLSCRYTCIADLLSKEPAFRSPSTAQVEAANKPTLPPQSKPQVKKAIDYLKGLKAAKPRKKMTLLSTLEKVVFKKDNLSKQQLSALFDSLRKMGMVEVDDKQYIVQFAGAALMRSSGGPDAFIATAARSLD